MEILNLSNFRAVEIVAQHMVTDMASSFGQSFIELSGAGMAKKAAEKCFEECGMTSSDVDVLEVCIRVQ